MAILQHGPNINYSKRGTTLRHHPARTVETTMPLSDAAVRLNLGSCEDDDPPNYKRSADVPVGIGVGAVRSGLKKLGSELFCSKPTRVGLIDLGDSIGLPDRGAFEGFDSAGFIEMKNRIELL